jgi:hypothetical protein
MGSDGFGSRSFADGGTVNATQTLFTRAGGLNVFPAPLTIVGSTVGGFDSLWTSSRVDICKWQMDDLFSQTAYQYNGTGGASLLPFIPPVPADILRGPSTRLRMLQTLSPWAIRATQQNPADASNPVTNHFVGYPRVEKAALGPSRSEQMLAAPVLAANCSNFKIEWTWDDGVGRNLTLTGGAALTGEEQIGMYVRPGAARPWFGLDDGLTGSNVAPASSAPIFPILNEFPTSNASAYWGGIGPPLANADNAADHVYCAVEGPRNPANGTVIWSTSPTQDSKRVYQAVFGLNQDDPGVTLPSEPYRGPYTPLPSALRITLRLHDTLGRIEGGREYQFIVELPKR